MRKAFAVYVQRNLSYLAFFIFAGTLLPYPEL